MGDLALDVVGTAQQDAARIGGALVSGSNAFLDIPLVARVGGSAFHFALAVASGSRNVPVLVGVVGRDALGDAVIADLQRQSLTTEGIWRVSSAATTIICVAYFNGNVRLMMQPNKGANGALREDQALAAVGVSTKTQLPPRLLWISGYSLRDRSAPRFRACCRVAAWAQANNVPVYVDLVPHDFAHLVGSLEQLIADLGSVNGLVAEFDTVVGLGIADPKASLHAAGIALAEHGRCVGIVQRKAQSGVYAQAVASTTGQCHVQEHLFTDSEERGLGDRLAVHALVEKEALDSLQSGIDA